MEAAPVGEGRLLLDDAELEQLAPALERLEVEAVLEIQAALVVGVPGWNREE